MSDELPTGWLEVAIADVVDINPPGSTVVADDDQLVTFLPMAAVEELTGRVDTSGERRFGEVRKGFTRFRDGDLLFAKITPCMENGKIAVVRGLRGGLGCGSTEFHVLRAAEDVHPDYVRYFVGRTAFRREAKRNMSGAVGQQRVPVDFLRNAEIPLAPSREQNRIVSKIEELFSRIEEGERALERVQKLVERYRQSVLKAAVTGELTRAWREQHKDKLESGEALLQRILKARRAAWEKAELDKMKAKGQKPVNDQWKQKYQEPTPTVTTDLPELPEGWVWATLEQLCSVFGNGLSRKPENQPPGEPILRISAVRPLSVDLSDIRFYVPEKTESLDGFYAEPGDLLFTRYNGSRELVGVSGVVSGSDRVLHPDKLIKARVAASALVTPKYLVIATNSGLSWRHITSCVKTSAGQHGVAGTDIKRTPIPVPPPAEQLHIADLFASVATKCDKAMSACASENRRSNGMRQAILKAAFAGSLVPQDPTEEPASILLERIAAERDAVNTAPKRGRKPGKST